MKLLLIEDSEVLRRNTAIALGHEGFTVDEANDGLVGLRMAQSNNYDLIILDVMLPNLDGMAILRRLRQQNNHVRILMLSAKSGVQDKIDALTEGADDYLCKPFSFEELKARVLAILRRRSTIYSNLIYNIADFQLDLDSKTFSYQSHIIELTKNEFKLLHHIFANQGKVVSIENISESIVGSFDLMAKNTIESHLSAIRRKVRQFNAELPIKNKRGFGYFIDVLQ